MSDLRLALYSPRTADPDAPVVIRYPALGDTVLLTPLLAALAERHGRPVHLLASGPWTPVLLGADPAVGELRLVHSRRAPFWLTPSQWTALQWLKAHRGPVYHCERDEFGERLVRRAGLADAQVLRAWQHYPGDNIHWIDWWLQIARLDPAAHPLPGGGRPVTVPARPRIAMPPAWLSMTRRWLHEHSADGRPIVLLQPGHKKTHKRGRIGTGHYDKHWPETHWAEVIRGVLATLPDAAVLVCGSQREARMAQAILDAVGPVPAGARLINVARRPSLERLVALASIAHSMVSVDTGPAHAAGAMDCPLVVLYGQAGWGRWLPRTATSDVIPLGPQWPTDGRRVLDLRPDEVVQAWRRLRPRVMAGGQDSGSAR